MTAAKANLRREVADLHKRITALEEIIADRLRLLPAALEASTVRHQDAAGELGVSEARISQLIGRGRLAAVRFGSQSRITKESLDEELARRGLTIKGDRFESKRGNKAS